MASLEERGAQARSALMEPLVKTGSTRTLGSVPNPIVLAGGEDRAAVAWSTSAEALVVMRVARSLNRRTAKSLVNLAPPRHVVMFVRRSLASRSLHLKV